MKIVHNYRNVEFTIYIVAALVGIGLVMVHSTQVIGLGVGGENFMPVLKQLIWILCGTFALIVMAKIDYHHFLKYYKVCLLVSLVSLLVVLIPSIGSEVNGARRWIRFGNFFGFQPSDMVKICLLIFVSAYIVRNNEKMKEFGRGFVIPLIIIGANFILLLLEPDFGTAVFLLITSIAVLVAGGTRIIYIFFTLIASVPFFHELVWQVPYRKARLLAFMNPWDDPNGSGYQLIQSFIAFGSGGLFGKGLGGSRQKLDFLPESSNDFILTIIGEEIGFIGIVVIITLFGLLVWNGIKICKVAPDLFGFLLAFGVTFMIGLQAVINIAVVSGSIPTKGIPLPFISAGGSSLFMFMLCIGILINIGNQGRKGIGD